MSINEFAINLGISTHCQQFSFKLSEMIVENYLVLMVISFKIITAQYTCSFYNSSICTIKQPISYTAPFTLVRNSSYPLTMIIIIETPMPKIPSSIFINCPTLSMFSTADTGLTSLDAEDFASCSYLSTIFIRNGLLTKIPDGSFKSCIYLKSLQLSNHSISTIEDNAFIGIKNLSTLYLTNNLLGSLSPNLFVNLPMLRSIDVSSNKLVALDGNLFKQNLMLSAFYCDFNGLYEVPLNLFASQKKMESLKISFNKLTSFQSVGASYTDVSNNQLTSFNFSTGENTIHISDNFVRKLNCPQIETLSVRRFYAQNNSLTNFRCIRDMKNLTDTNLTSNSLKPSAKAFQNLKRLRLISIFNQKKYPKFAIKAFAPLTGISNIYVDTFQSFKNLRNITPSIFMVGLTTTTWSCNKTQLVAKVLADQKIRMNYNNSKDRTICNVTQPTF